MQLLEGLKWRYATKKFDASKTVSAENIEKIMEAVRLSASSYGLQLYKIMVVKDPELKAKLLPAGGKQSQIVDSSHLFIFCHYDDVTEQNIDEYIELVGEVRKLPDEILNQFGGVMKQSVLNLDLDTKYNWMARQTYIALGTLLAACGELKVDACPMEGFDNAKFDEILGLKEKGLKSAVMASVGYRAEEDQTQHMPKVRKSIDDLFEVL